mgnify:FL=1|jgi:hypothetical protein
MNTQERCNEILDWERAFAAYGKREAKLNLESAAKVLSNSFIEHHANNRFPEAAATYWIGGDITDQLGPPHRGDFTIRYLERVETSRHNDVFSALGRGTFQREDIEAAMKHPEMKRLKAAAYERHNHAIFYLRKLEELEQSIHPRTIDTSDITDEQIDAAMAIYEPALVRNKSEIKVK